MTVISDIMRTSDMSPLERYKALANYYRVKACMADNIGQMRKFTVFSRDNVYAGLADYFFNAAWNEMTDMYGCIV